MRESGKKMIESEAEEKEAGALKASCQKFIASCHFFVQSLIEAYILLRTIGNYKKKKKTKTKSYYKG